MTNRGPITGTWRGARFNWPLYAAALAVAIAGVGTLVVADAVLPRIAPLFALAGALWFLDGLHLVYDRSDLHRGGWLARALPQLPQHLAICHYDEVSALVRDTLSPASMTLLDHDAEATKSEHSIRRARRLFPPAPGTLAASHTAWAAWLLATFWAARLYCQRFVYRRDLWRGKRFETAVHWLFTGIWAAFTTLFTLCAARQSGFLG